MTKKELNHYYEFSQNIAREAGKLLLEKSRRRNRIHYKGRVDLVTEADVASERFIVDSVKKEFPQHSILAEEEAARENNPDYKWIIDPLDGTTNFAHGFPAYCVSVALEYRRDIVVGAVYDPERDELFCARLGGGSYLNGNKNRVTSQTRLERSLLATGFPYDIGSSRENNLRYFNRFARLAQGIRRAGSAALDLCYLGCGRFDGFWELKLHPWDVAAGMLVVKEAGGKVTDFQGKKYSIYGKYILASNSKIHSRMKAILNL